MSARRFETSVDVAGSLSGTGHFAEKARDAACPYTALAELFAGVCAIELAAGGTTKQPT